MHSTNVVNGEAVAASQMKLLSAELFLQENYLFRHNVLNGKLEFSAKPQTDGTGLAGTDTRGTEQHHRQSQA